MIERVREEAFDGARLLRPGVVIVGFLADWCPYCVRFLPDLASLERPKAPVLLADLTDESSPLWDTFQVAIVPSVVVFRDGLPVFRADGIPARGLGPSDLISIRAAVDRLVRD